MRTLVYENFRVALPEAGVYSGYNIHIWWRLPMKFRKFSLGLAAAALAAIPVAAQVTVAPLDGEESEAVSGTAVIIGVVAAAAVVGAVILASDDDTPALPVSG